MNAEYKEDNEQIMETNFAVDTKAEPYLICSIEGSVIKLTHTLRVKT